MTSHTRVVRFFPYSEQLSFSFRFGRAEGAWRTWCDSFALYLAGVEGPLLTGRRSATSDGRYTCFKWLLLLL
jgi:hypothetical protein